MLKKWNLLQVFCLFKESISDHTGEKNPVGG